MDSSAVITQISKEEARSPLRSKGTGERGGALRPGAAKRREPRLSRGRQLPPPPGAPALAGPEASNWRGSWVRV